MMLGTGDGNRALRSLASWIPRVVDSVDYGRRHCCFCISCGSRVLSVARHARWYAHRNFLINTAT